MKRTEAQRGALPAAVSSTSGRDAAHAEKRRVIQSAELFAGKSAELAIEHNGEIYCLRRTSKGKLILTK